MLRTMDQSGFDTLKATRALEAAGFDSGQAEAMVTVFGGAVVGNLATKWDFRDLKDEIGALRTEMTGTIDGLRAEMTGTVDGLRTEMTGIIDGLRTEMTGIIDGLRTEMTGAIDGLRNEFDAKLEKQIGGLRTEMTGAIDGLRNEFDARLEKQIGALRVDLKSDIATVRLSVESLRASMYRLLLAQAVLIVSLILGLQRLL